MCARSSPDAGWIAAAASRVLDTFHGAMTIANARELVATIREAVARRRRARRILTLSAGTSAAGYVRFDPSLARGLSYYTGAIMEVAVPDLAGSLGGGGRYDGLIGMFLGEDVPACGFSLGLERILVVMGERSMFPAEVQQASADVLVTLFDAETLPEVAAACGRAAGGRRPRRGLSGAGQARQADEVRGGEDDSVCRDSRRRRARARRGDDQEPADGRAGVGGPGIGCGQGQAEGQVFRPRITISMQIEPLGKLARTHTCGALRATDVGQDVVLLGWVHRVRDLGSLVFIDLRDRYGVTQVVARDDDTLVADAKRLRSEFVVAVLGRVEHRAPETVNSKIATGQIEVSAHEIRLLNEAKTPPFMIADDVEVSEETRLKYRYIDLRRPRMQRNMIMRHRATMATRQYFDEQGFLEIETPMLTKSTPEGARDYLVPSRVHPGEFFALPQSPQIFKQILMIAGMDRYFQIVKCFRDEDLRADRQPEFTQVDLEIVVRDRGPCVRDARAADGAADGAHRPRRAAAVPAAAVCGGDREIRVGQAGPAMRHGDRVTSPPPLQPRSSRSSATRSRPAARCGGSPCPARRSIRAASSTSWSNRRSSSAAAGSSGRARRTRRSRARR